MRKAHLLIIDDEPNTLASLSRAFRLAGHDATVCDQPARALELVKNEQFDLILSDVVMPGKDGIALLEEIKSLGVTTPVVGRAATSPLAPKIPSAVAHRTPSFDQPTIAGADAGTISSVLPAASVSTSILPARI